MSVNGYLKGAGAAAFDLLFWNGDDTNLPGPMYCWYLRQTYLGEPPARARRHGAVRRAGGPVAHRRARHSSMPRARTTSCRGETAYASTALLGGDDRFVLGASGHIAGVINPPAKRKRHHWTGRCCSPMPRRGSRRRNSVDGSWWPAWSDWLRGHAGRSWLPRRVSAGNAEFTVIEAGPRRATSRHGRESRAAASQLSTLQGDSHDRHRDRGRATHGGRQIWRHARQDRRARPRRPRGQGACSPRPASRRMPYPRSSWARCWPPAPARTRRARRVIKARPAAGGAGA